MVLLLVLGVTATLAGGWVAFDVRGAAGSLERWQERNHELRARATGSFAPPDRWITATGYRLMGALVSLCGLVLLLLSAV